MALQPTRRQKRPIVLRSDNEEDLVTPSQYLSDTVNCLNNQFKSKRVNGDTLGSQPLPKRSRPRTRSSTSKPPRSTSTRSTPPESIEKSSRKKSKAPKNGKTELLHPYFNAADIKRHQLLSQQISTNEAEINHTGEEEEDGIEDDVTELGFSKYPSLRSATKFVLDRRKQQVVSKPRALDPTISEKHQSSSQISAIPKRVLSERPSQYNASSPDHEDLKPWAEKYGPTGLEELTVHKKKVAEVQNWMKKFWQDGNQKKLLILKGPAGAGKTATVTALAKALDIDVVEWRNPKDSQFSLDGYVSMSAQFEDFLHRSGTFGSLEFDPRTPNGKLESAIGEPGSEFANGRMILLEEFPTILAGASAAALSFRTSLFQYLARNSPSFALPGHRKLYGNQTPVVMIITESHNVGNSTDDVFSAHRLLGPDILGHPSVSVIEFNSMAPTYVVKALEMVVKKEARQSGRRRLPGITLLKKLGDTGDVRSAISALEFLCLRNTNEDDWGGMVAHKVKSKNTPSSLTKSEGESLEKITRREASLGIFHAVGKVVYNKREELSNTHPLPPQPPDHITQHARVQISLVSPDELIDSTGTDRQTFVAALHENYVSSCEGTSFIESLNGCLDVLSDTDILGSERSGRGGGLGGMGGNGRGASDSLRQDEIGFHLTVRGILFALPYPVKRCTSLSGVPGRSGGKGDAFKMFYPTSLRLWRQMEEVESLIDRSAERYKAGTLHSRRSLNTPQSGATVASGIGTYSKSSGPLGNDDYNSSSADVDPLCQCKNASREELILETLPYLAMIQRSKAAAFPDVRELEQITEFRGLDKLSDEIVGNNEVWSSLDRDADRATTTAFSRGSSIKTRTYKQQPSGSSAAAAPPPPTLRGETEPEIEKLWLSDDDIEDE